MQQTETKYIFSLLYTTHRSHKALRPSQISSGWLMFCRTLTCLVVQSEHSEKRTRNLTQTDDQNFSRDWNNHHYGDMIEEKRRFLPWGFVWLLKCHLKLIFFGEIPHKVLWLDVIPVINTELFINPNNLLIPDLMAPRRWHISVMFVLSSTTWSSGLSVLNWARGSIFWVLMHNNVFVIDTIIII